MIRMRGSVYVSLARAFLSIYTMMNAVEKARMNKNRRKAKITLIREGDLAILCERGHLKVAKWKLAGPGGRKFKAPHLYPVGNWQVLEPAARGWLYHAGIALQEGECAVCPPGLTLQEMTG